MFVLQGKCMDTVMIAECMLSLNGIPSAGPGSHPMRA